MLNKKYRLKEKKEFQRIYKKGYKAKGYFGMLIFLPDSLKSRNTQIRTKSLSNHNSLQTSNNQATKTSSSTLSQSSRQLKFGIVANKKVGNAVQRQKIKRQVRGIIQEHLLANTFENTNGLFSYILFKRATDQKEYQQLKSEIAKQLKQFNLNNV